MCKSDDIEMTESDLVEIAVADCPECGCDMDDYGDYRMCCNCEHVEENKQ